METEISNLPQIHFYTPSALINIIGNAINIGEAKKMISVKGVYLPGRGQSYNDYYYDTLKDEASDFQLTLIVPALFRAQLQPNKVIEFSGYITKRIGNRGAVEFQVNLSQLLTQSHNQFSEEEIKSLEIQQKKSAVGYRDVEAHLKSKIVKDEKINIVIIVGRTNIIHDDIKSQMMEAVGFYNITFHPVNLSSQSEIESAISLYNKPEIDVIAISRGGGDNLEMFNKPTIAEKVLDINPLFITAIGHKQDITLLQKMADKAFITPTSLGQFLKEIYNNTKAELANSKAKLVHDITTQLTTNYSKQLQNLNDQLKSTKELNEKTLLETKRNYSEQVTNLNAKLKSFEELAAKTSQEKISLHSTEVNNLKKQIQDLTNNHQTQLSQVNGIQNEKVKALTDQIKTLENNQSEKDKLIQQTNNIASQYQKQLQNAQDKSSPNLIYIIIAIIIGLIIGLLIK